MSVKTVLITGANSGIGRALTLEFAEREYKIFATDLSFSEETRQAFNAVTKGEIVTDLLDVTKIEDIIRVKERITKETDGKLDYLYCNAGIVLNCHAVDITDDQLEKIYNVNLFSTIRLVREFVRLVLNARGTIVFSGSVTKFLPMHSNALYASTKAALDQYAYILHSELKNYGVRVYNVLGGAVKTPIFPNKAVKIPQGSIYDFDEYKKIYSKRGEVTTKAQQEGMEPEVFAKRVLKKLENASPDTFQIYEGKKATTIYLAGTWLSAKLMVTKYLDMFGLNFDYRQHLKGDRIGLD